MQVRIFVIPHNQQRYDTIGDWWYSTDATGEEWLDIRVSREIIGWRSQMAVATHELVEALLCKGRNIDQHQVDEWDLAHRDVEDPGSIFNAPYHKEHMEAQTIEQRLVHELAMNWSEHNDFVSFDIPEHQGGKR